MQHTNSNDSNYSTKRAVKPGKKSAIWYGANEKVSIQGYDIQGGLIYVGEDMFESSKYNNEASLINPKLDVLPGEAWLCDDLMGYWLHYSRMSAKGRGAYLKWLAGGRLDPDAYISYVLLFFYGLERRMFLDVPKGIVPNAEQDAIIQEVVRLRKLYGENRSFRDVANNFLAMEWIYYHSGEAIPAHIDLDNKYCLKPFQFILAKCIAGRVPISAEIILQWFKLHPKFKFPRFAKRSLKEFKALFFHYYELNFGKGLMVKPNRIAFNLKHQVENPSLPVINPPSHIPDLPNPFFLTAPLKKIADLLTLCIEQLYNYSRFISRKDNDPNSLIALALLPEILIQQDQKFKNAQENILQLSIDKMLLVSLDYLYDCFGKNKPLQFNIKESNTLSTLLELLGYGMAPDIRFHKLKRNLNGVVVLFSPGHGEKFQPSQEFYVVVTIIRLSVILEQTNTKLSTARETFIQNIINNHQSLTDTEKHSLLAFLHYCLSTHQGITGLNPTLGQISHIDRRVVGHTLISLAFADGSIVPSDIKKLEKIYKALRLDKEQVTKNLHILMADSEPVTVANREQGNSFSIPKPRVQLTQGFCLDEELIRVRAAETRQVKDVLHEIFTEHVDTDKDISQSDITVTNTVSDTVTGNVAGPLAALDQEHQDLFQQLAKQEIWQRDAITKLCKKLGLMPDGAMEVLNEWAFENANAPLIDEDDVIYIDLNIAREILDAK